MSKNASTLFSKNFKFDNLNEIYERNIHFHTAAGIDKVYKHNFDIELNEKLSKLEKKIKDGTYKLIPYKEKLVIKDRESKPRMISIPTIQDKIVLKALHKLLQELFNIKQLLVQTVVDDVKIRTLKFNSYIKIDITNFYGSIDHDILMKILNKKIRKKELRSLIKNTLETSTNSLASKKFNNIKNEIGIPQGLPVSNVLAEIYMKDFDVFMRGLHIECYFVRYVDDIIILCDNKNIDELSDIVHEYLETNLLLETHPHKTRKGTISDGFEFLGYKFYYDNKSKTIKLTVKDSARLKIETRIVADLAKFKNDKTIPSRRFLFTFNNKITGSISKKVHGDEEVEKKYGWLFFYSQLDDVKLLYQLDYLVNKTIKKFELEKRLNGLEVKSYVKAYYEIIQNRSKSKYIHKPDKLNYDEKIKLLVGIFGYKEDVFINGEVVDKHYYKQVYTPIKELEKDIQKFSGA